MRTKQMAPPGGLTAGGRAAPTGVLAVVLASLASLAVLAGLFLGGCARGKQNNTGARITDRSGLELTIPARSERVISTAPSNTEIIIELGLAEKLVAVDTYSAALPGLAGEPALIDFMYPDGEFILTLNPDIIIAAEHNRAGSGNDPFKLIQEAGITVVYIPTSNSIQGIYGDIRFIAEVLGAAERGDAVIRRMQEEVETIAARGASISPKKSVYMEISPFPFMVSCGGETYLNEMIEIIGAENIFAHEKGWFSPAAEAILERDPDVILTLVNVAGDSPQRPEDEIKNRPGFESLRAVKNNEVYSLDADSASRPSPGILLALRQMARVVYPDWYEERD
jgi:iron complex transport system substrate-binding protein